MRHHYTEAGKGAHFAANTNGFGSVITQLGDTEGEQTRIVLKPAEARVFAHRLLEVADKADTQLSLDEFLQEAKREREAEAR